MPRANKTDSAKESKLIETITEIIPAFFAPEGIISQNKGIDGKLLNLSETIAQCESFFAEHKETFLKDISKSTYLIMRTTGTIKKWGLSLKFDGTLDTLPYEEFKALLIKNFGDSKEQKYALIEKLLSLKQTQLGKAAEYTIKFRHYASRIEWPSNVMVDLIRRGLIQEVRDEYDKESIPKTLFDATNLIIEIDKKRFLRNKNENECNFKERKNNFNAKRKINIVGSYKNCNLNKKNRLNFSSKPSNKQNNDNNILSINYTTDKRDNCMITTFFIKEKEDRKIPIRILIDSGSSKSLICNDFVRNNKITTYGMSSPVDIKLPNNKTMKISRTTKKINLNFRDHHEEFEFNVANLQFCGIDAILGRNWLIQHKPYIDFSNNKIYFLGKYCKDHCPSSQRNNFFIKNDINAAIIEDGNSDIDSFCMCNDEDYTALNNDSVIDGEICATAISSELTESLNQCKYKDILYKYYEDYFSVFDKHKAEILPPHRQYDMDIKLIPGAQLYFGPIYSLTYAETEELKKYLKENLEKGFIQKSSSPAGAPIVFVKKHDGSLRLCVDYRRLNANTIRDSYPIPKINDLIESFKDAKIFSRLDLKSAYNLIRIKEGCEYLTAFRTTLGHFEYRVMPFGLRNAPAVFQRFVQDIFAEDIGQYIQIYLDDIIIFSANTNDHITHVRTTLQKLKSNNLFVKLEKCDFHVLQTSFLGFVVSTKGILMDENKIDSIKEWPTPKSLKDLQSFLGFCNFYRRFIKNFAEIMNPLRKLLKHSSNFQWSHEANSAFNKLKDAFNKDNFLIYPDRNKEFTIETDASDFALGCILSQISDLDNLLHPIAFYSRCMTPSELNYTIYDKELLAIVVAFDIWRHHLEGAKFPVRIFSDHRNLLYFKSPQKLNSRQIRWSIFLSRFDFKIAYRPGNQSGKPDALSRRADYFKESKPYSKGILSNTNFCFTATTAPNVNTLFLDAQKKDKFCQSTISRFSKNISDNSSSAFSLRNDLLYFKNRIVVPTKLRTKILKTLHDSPIGGHLGIDKTLDKISRSFWWPLMKDDITNYVNSCPTCCKCKIRRHKEYGELTPLPIPNKPWEVIAIDFIVHLPSSQNNTCIMVVADHLTKMVHLIATTDVPSSEFTAKLLLHNVFRFHGFPKVILSDHGLQFSSAFWSSLCSSIGASPHLATAHHQQTNGQIERMNSVIEQYLRCYCSSAQHDWCFYLPFCEMAYNSSKHSSINCTPFSANYGFNPKMDLFPNFESLTEPANNLIIDWNSHFDALRQHLSKAKADFKKFADGKRIPGPIFKMNDLVWLKRFYFSNEPSRKLSEQYLGPFRIIEVLERNNYKLLLPETMRLFPVFHISQLEPYVKRKSIFSSHADNIQNHII